MKKLMVFAMAAMVALASCSKTELVDNSAPTPISFKAVTGSMTKAPETSVTQNLGVFAFTNTDKNPYFGNSPFTRNNEGTWSGGKFWPLISTLDFVVYYPYQRNNVTATYTQDDEDYVSLNVTIPNNSSEQKDYMYSDTYLTNKDKDADMNVYLNHALSMITVVFDGDIDDDGDDDITVNNVTLKNTYQSGTYNVTYTETAWGTPDIKWSHLDDLTDLSLDSTNPVLVVPTSNATLDESNFPEISFTYKMPECAPLTYTYKFNANPGWAPGTHYTYTIKITPSEIKFTPSVNGWADNNGSIGIQG